jgi:superfamily II DNA or RNA helicase
VALVATSVPNPSDISRAESFTREAFVHAGETTEDALGPGTARRRAVDAALQEIDAGAKVPSPEWRRRYSLMLGLERVLSDDEPKLADGTSLNPHQVDALSGTLTALLAEAQRNGDAPLVASAAPVLAVDDEPEEFDDEPEAVVEEEDDDPDDDDDDDDDEDEEPLDVEIDVGDDDDDDEDDEDEQDPDEDGPEVALDDDQLDEAPDDPNAHKRFWFEHATGAGKTVAAMGFVDASRTGGVLILTHRRNLVDQFHGELKDRGYAKRITPALLRGKDDANGPVTVETYQWFVRNAGKISEAYSIVICDEAHTALGEKTSAAIRAWTGPIFIGMTATGALIARHVTDLFPTQTSRFDLAQAARRGVISPLRCVRIPPGPGVRTIAKVPLRRGEVDTEFDQEMLAELLDQGPFNFAAADLYKTRFNGVPGVVYAAGVKHAYNLAAAFREQGLKAMAVSGETRKRELAEILARYERGDIDVLINAQLLAEGWNSPRATVCMHLAPTASKRIYQQRVGRVTRRNPGKEAGIVVDFVAPDTKNDDAVVTLHSLLDRDVYRGGAIVVGPVRRGRGRRLRVERRVLPVTSDEDRRIEVFERELWRIAVEHLPYGEQIQWAALAGRAVAPSGWRRARAMLHFDREGAIKRAFLETAVERNKNPQLRVRALQEIAASRDGEAFDKAIDIVGTWTREERREGTKVMLLSLAEKRIGRRDQANAWIWRLASYTREVHEEYAVQRWPETKRLLGLLVNSSGAAHARNARRLVHAARKQDRRLSAALLAAAIAHTPEGEEILRGARTRLARKPSALSRELLRNFPKSRGRRGSRRRRKKGPGEVGDATLVAQVAGNGVGSEAGSGSGNAATTRSGSRRSRSRNGRAARLAAAGAAGDASVAAGGAAGDTGVAAEAASDASAAPQRAPSEQAPASPRSRRSRNGRAPQSVEPVIADAGAVPDQDAAPGARRSRTRSTPTTAADDARAVEAITGAAAALAAARGPKEDRGEDEPKPRRRTRRGVAPAAAGEGDPAIALATPAAPGEASPAVALVETADGPDAVVEPPAPKPKPKRRPASPRSATPTPTAADEPQPAKPKRATRASTRSAAPPIAAADEPEPAKPKRATRASTRSAMPTPTAADEPEPAKPKRATRASSRSAAATTSANDDPTPQQTKPKRAARPSARTAAPTTSGNDTRAKDEPAPQAKPPAASRRPSAGPAPEGEASAAAAATDQAARPKTRRRAAVAGTAEPAPTPRAKATATDEPAEPKPRRRAKAAAAAAPAPAAADDAPTEPKPKRRTKPAATAEPASKPRMTAAGTDAAAEAKPKRRVSARRASAKAEPDAASDAPDEPVADGVESAA